MLKRVCGLCVVFLGKLAKVGVWVTGGVCIFAAGSWAVRGG